jgi:DNA polymerase III epsilon subunit-like protein
MSDDTYTLFFDTETTGLPKDRTIPAKNQANNWPDIVSIAWHLYKNGTLVNKKYHIIKPEGWTIPSESVKIHGIPTEVALQNGEPLKDVLDSFLQDVKVSFLIGAHNLEFDKNVIMNAMCWRLHQSCDSLWNTDAEFCSGEESKPELKLYPYGKKSYGYKMPSLDELYYDTFKVRRNPGAHNAACDVEDLTKICWKRWNILDKHGNPLVFKESNPETKQPVLRETCTCGRLAEEYETTCSRWPGCVNSDSDEDDFYP